VTDPIVSPLSLEEKLTLSPAIGCPSASVTVAVAVDVDDPFATIDDGTNPTITPVAGPTVCTNVPCPETCGETELSVAVIVGDPTVVELVIVAVYVPSP
jgi:hypothetical protein